MQNHMLQSKIQALEVAEVQLEAEKKSLKVLIENEKELRTMAHYEYDRTQKENLLISSEIKDVRRWATS